MSPGWPHPSKIKNIWTANKCGLVHSHTSLLCLQSADYVFRQLFPYLSKLFSYTPAILFKNVIHHNIIKFYFIVHYKFLHDIEWKSTANFAACIHCTGPVNTLTNWQYNALFQYMNHLLCRQYDALFQDRNPLLFKLSTESLITCSVEVNCKPKSISFLAGSFHRSNPGWVSFGRL